MGPARREGFRCLGESVRRATALYPECDFLICHNQLDEEQVRAIGRLGVPLYDQSESDGPFGVRPTAGYQVHWKLYPPRVAADRHEIVMDNDLVLFKRLEEIDYFLSGDCTLMCQGLNGLHGKFDRYIPKGVRVNSGLFGMPPGFDFLGVVRQHIDQQDAASWDGRFDEQGLVAAALNTYPKKAFVPVTRVPILERDFDIRGITTDACCGFHFVGLNYHERHAARDTYNEMYFMSL